MSSAIEETKDTAAADGDLSGQMEDILSSIQGAGTVKVMITYASGSEIVPATSENTETTTTTEQHKRGKPDQRDRT